MATKTAARGAGRPRRRVPRAIRERQMIEVAGRVFAERGYHAASMDEIAAGVGISKPMLYAYFDSKEGLYRACVSVATERLLASVGDAAAEGPPERRLWAGILAFFSWVEEHRDGWALLNRDVAGAPFAEELARSRAQTVRLTGRLFTEAGQAEGINPQLASENEALADAFAGAAEALANRWLDHPEEPKELQALRLMNLTWMGLGDLVRGQLWLPEEPR
jgi:AcrR family transcriptional regulator